MTKRLQTVAAVAFTKTLLMVFNFGFWVTGIAMMAIGIWMEVELYKYMELSSEFSSSASYVLIGTGAVIVVVGALACCCTVKGQPILLYIYGSFLLAVLVVQFAAAISIYAYRHKLEAGFGLGLNQSLADYHKAGDTEKSDEFDVMQATLHCCGSRNYLDWTDAPFGRPPQSCCQIKNCDTTDETQVYHEGCYSKVIDYLNSNIGLVGGIAVAIAFFPLLGVVLSCCLAKNINKAKYEQMA